jgi:hypothetical protein
MSAHDDSSHVDDIWAVVESAIESGDNGLNVSTDELQENHQQQQEEDEPEDKKNDMYLVHRNNHDDNDDNSDNSTDSGDSSYVQEQEPGHEESAPAPRTAPRREKKRGNHAMINRLMNEYDLDEYDDGRNPNSHNNKIKRNRNNRSQSTGLDEVDAAMEMGLNEVLEEDEYESVPLMDLDWTKAVKREKEYEAKMMRENKTSIAGCKPEPYDPNFNFLSYAVETKSQESLFPAFKNMYTFFADSESTSEYVDLCIQVQDYYNEHIRPISSIGNKCWPVRKIWEFFHVISPTIKHIAEYELRCMNRLFDVMSDCVLKKNKTTGKVDQVDTKCLNIKFKIMDHRHKLAREVINLRFNQSSSSSSSSSSSK